MCQLMILLSGNHHIVYYSNLNQKNSQAMNYLLLSRKIGMAYSLYFTRSTFTKRQASSLTICLYIFTNYIERRCCIFLICTTRIWQKMLPRLMSNYVMRMIWSCIMLQMIQQIWSGQRILSHSLQRSESEFMNRIILLSNHSKLQIISIELNQMQIVW